MNERQFRKQVTDAATSTGWVWWYTDYSKYSTPGWPDLALARPPRVILTELKTPRGRLSPEQVTAREILSQCDRIEYHLWLPTDFDLILGTLGVNVHQPRLL